MAKIIKKIQLEKDGVIEEFDLAGSAGTTDYTNLENKPSINSIELDGDKTSDDLGLQNKLTAGKNVDITDDTISVEDFAAVVEYEYLDESGALKLKGAFSSDKPWLWETDKEINLGGGLYGKRYTGTWSGNTTSTLDTTITSPSVRIVDYGLWQQRTTGDRLQLIGSPYNDGTTRGVLQFDTSGVKVSHTWASASDYDVWIKYIKLS